MELPKPMMPDFGGSPLNFFKEVKSELLKVSWPTRDEVIKLTLIVIGVSVVLGVYIGGLDFIFTNLTNFLVRR